MFKNYCKIAWRNVCRYRFFSIINIFGLAMSMSVCLGVVMLVADQYMYDGHNTRRDRIYRIESRNLNPDGSTAGNEYATSPQPFAPWLIEHYTGVEQAVRLRRGFGNSWMDMPGQDVNIPLHGFFADANVLDFFQYELEEGDPRTALVNPYSVVLTRKAAKKLFSLDHPIGEVIDMGPIGIYTVTGILKETENKSHIVFEALASYASIKSLESKGVFQASDGDWGSGTSGWVYLLLKPSHEPGAVEHQLAALVRERGAVHEEEGKKDYSLTALTAITPGTFINNPIGPFMPMIFVYFFGGLALLVMIASCFNYTNLSIARSLTRAREIGVRKSNGAARRHIFFQFISEAIVVALLALVMALVLLLLVKPFILNLRFARMLHWDMEGNIYVYGIFVVFSILAGLLAGFFPAVVMSGFRPVQVLKNAAGLKLFSRNGLRRTLVVVQFSLSIIFIVSATVLYNQLQLFMTADHGFDMTNTINVRVGRASPLTLQQELTTHANIVGTAAASHVPATGVSYGAELKRNLSDAEPTSLDYFMVDEHYLTTLQIPLVAGDNFTPGAVEHNNASIVLNEEAVKQLHFASPQDAVGETVYLGDSSQVRVIGVVRNYNHEMMVIKLTPMALRYDTSQLRIVHVRYTGDYEAAASSIAAAWAKVHPSRKIDYIGFRDEVEKTYQLLFGDLTNIVGVIAFLAIMISCLGLLGMATYSIETRLKEISIRKVLGANGATLLLLLSKGFLLLLLIALAIAIPAAWFLNEQWLQLLAYRIPIGAKVIGFSTATVVVLGGLTIGSQALRAVRTAPLEHLGRE
jgi:putative ABC transport system permease protein